MKPFSALPLLVLAGCSGCQPTRFSWPGFVDSAPLTAFLETGGQHGGASTTLASEPAVNASEPAAVTPSVSSDTPASSEPPEASSQPSAPSAETPATQTPSAPSTNDGVGGQQETREESHDRG